MMRWITIQPYRWTEKDIADQQKKCMELEEAGVNHIAFCSSLEPENSSDLFKKAELLAAQFRKLKGQYKGKAKVGILVQSLLSHGWRTEALEGFPEIITVTGANNHRFCPLSRSLRDYTAKMIRIICEAEPDFLLVDDDFRMIAAGMGCYCPDHLKRFSKEMGKEYSLEELRDILNRKDAESCRIGKAYETFNMKTLHELAKIIRESIDSVNPELECGFCTSSQGEYLYAAETGKILAGKTKPFIRLNNGYYINSGALSFPYRQMNTAIQQYYINKEEKIETMAESDTYPQHRFSLSIADFEMHICSSLLTGCDAIKMWIDNFHCNHSHTVQKFTDYILKNGKKFQTLQKLNSQFRLKGAAIPLPDNPPGSHNPIGDSKHIRVSDFIADSFGPLGIASKYGDDDGKSVLLLSGGHAEYYTDEELQSFLKRNVILDSAAVKLIHERGFGHLIGVKEVSSPAPSNSGEFLTHPVFASEQISNPISFLRPGTIRITPEDHAEVLTELRVNPFMGAACTEAKTICPATILFRNELGGSVISLSFPMTRENWSRLNNLVTTDKKIYFAKLLELLDPANPPVYVAEDQHCYLMYLEHKEKPEFLAGVFNLTQDLMREIPMRFGRKVKEISLLQGDGTFRAVTFRQDGGLTVIPNPDLDFTVVIRGTFE